MYIFNSPEKYGLIPYYYNGKIIAGFIVSSHPNFQPSASSGPFKYALVLYPDPTSEKLSFFILMSDSTNIFPNEYDPTLLGEPEQTSYVHGGYYLMDIIKNGMRIVEEVVEKASSSYNHDTLWKKMVRSMEMNDESLLHVEERNVLFEKSSRTRNAFDIDPKLKSLYLLGEVDEIFGRLCSKYRHMVHSKGDTYNVLLLNPWNEDYMIHLVSGNGEFNIFLESREGIASDVEYDHLDGIIREISRFLFEQAIKH
jgi:hypothetical protein